MKNTRFCLSLLVTFGTLGLANASAQDPARKPQVIPLPAVNDGSNASRAPFPAARPFNDATPPDGDAIDRQLPPNTPATDPAPHALPAPAVAVLQDPADAVPGEPALMPTGRPTMAVATSLDADRLAPAIRSVSPDARAPVIADVSARVEATEDTLRAMRASADEMSPAGHAQFVSAHDEVRAAERRLRSSLRATNRAADHQFEAARAELAANFDAYAAAVGRVDAVAGLTPTGR